MSKIWIISWAHEGVRAIFDSEEMVIKWAIEELGFIPEDDEDDVDDWIREGGMWCWEYTINADTHSKTDTNKTNWGEEE